jgi:ParB family chromosome partitioning protein
MTDGKQKLDYLFGLSPEMPRIIEIELTKLRPNPDQPRKRFNEETIKELAASIEQHGLIQPISVVPDPESQDGFVIAAGERLSCTPAPRETHHHGDYHQRQLR